jgi:hypothetical protein
MTYEHYNNNKYTDKLQDSLLGTEAIDKDTIVEYNNESYDNTTIYSLHVIRTHSFISMYIISNIISTYS